MRNPNEIKIISVYPVEIPFHALGSKWVGRKKPEHLDSTVVIVETAAGLTGVGESCPIGAIYLPAFAAGLRAALEEMAPALLGQDATQINQVYRVMDEALFGHAYARAAIDIACWDLLGKHCAQPVSQLLGGRFQSKIPAYASIPLREVDEMVATLKKKKGESYTRFQIKIGDEPIVDCQRVKSVVEAGRPEDLFMADANRGWSKADSLRAVDAINDIDCYLEQPCATYKECRTVRQVCARPIVLDESALDLETIIRGWHEGACDAVNLKIGRVGGLTPALQMRDLCSVLGIPFHVQCAGGSNITQAAIVHLAHSSAPDRLLYIWDIGDLTSFNTAANPIPRKDGKMHAHHLPGLGVEPIESVLGEPVAVYG